MLPQFDSQGDLPPGIHAASLDEIENRFGLFAASDRRVRLFALLKLVVSMARDASIVEHLLIAGSFVTSKPQPNDVDVILLISSNVDFDELTPIQCAVADQDALRRTIRSGDVDALALRDGTIRALKAIEFFRTNRHNKAVGLVEVKL